jgi:hypothetical protein
MGETNVKPLLMFASRRRVAALVVFLLGLAVLATSAAGYPNAPASATPAPSPTPKASPPPAPTQSGVPPIIINIPPAIGNNVPQAPVDNSAPVLLITGYRTDPSPVQSGQPFTLTLTVTNTGTKYANSIHASIGASASFVGLGAPVSVAEQLDPKQSATFSLLVQPGTLAGGAYPLSIQFSYRVGESGEQGTSGSVGIQVAGSGSGVRGDPQVVVRSAAPLTQPQAIGQSFDVQVVLNNAGARKAYGVAATLVQNDNLSAAEGSGSASAGDLAPGQTVTLTVSLVLNKATDNGRVSQTFKLAYRDANNTAFTNNETASLELGLSGSQKPQLIVASQSLMPEHPGPGDTFTLTLQLRNVGSGPARQVLARLGNADGLKPFVPLGTGNVGFVDQIAPGATATFSATLLMDGASAGGVYTIPIELGYADALAEPLTETEVVGVLTLARPQLQIDLTKALPDPLAAGQGVDLPIEVINIGRQTLDISTVEVQSDDLSITKGSAYIGPLDASISGTLTAHAVANKSGAASFRVIVHYRDELNQMQSAEQIFTVQVAAAAPEPVTTNSPTSPSATGGLMSFLLRLVGIGG